MSANKGKLPFSLQASYLALFSVSIVGALWLKGHPASTMGVLVAIVPIGLLSRLPHRWFPGWLRQLLQVAIGGVGVWWWYQRMTQTTMDLALAEAIAILGVALVLGGVAKEYEWLILLSLILLGFGGLYPGRTIYLPAFICYAVAAVLVLYQTRTFVLMRTGKRGGEPPVVPVLKQNWGYRAMHLSVVAAATVLLLSSLPMPRGESRGIVPVSFQTKQKLEFPELWTHWIKPTKFLVSSEGKAQQGVEADEKPTILSKRASRLVRTDKAESMDAREGNGGSGIGTDLVFRVKSPAKLYWLAQLYDVYDGNKWKSSKHLREAGSTLDRFHARNEREIRQQYSIEKNVSPRLYGAYKVKSFSMSADGKKPLGDKSASIVGRRLLVEDHLGGAMLSGELPEPPWTYTAESMVPCIEAETPYAPWQSSRRAGWNYRKLPKKYISDRLRRLAEDLTADCETSMEKANVLRDYLRKNFEYTLEPPPIPKDKEAVDWFLFETREGYCTHFAQALTVLARLSGLHARLATGYSPGNYNLLSDCFEVYEYHAHAWVQIFIEPYGWLTYDGVPPGELQLDTTPTFFHSLMDPFGDEWASHPPELSLPLKQPKTEKDETSQQSSDGASEEQTSLQKAYDKIYDKAVTDSRTADPDTQQLVQAAMALVNEYIQNLWKELKTGAMDWASTLWERSIGTAKHIIHFFQELSLMVYVCIIACWLVLHATWRQRGRIRQRYAKWKERWQCGKLWEQLEKARHDDPVAVVSMCYLLSQRLLALVECRRHGNLDALEFADWLMRHDRVMGMSFSTISLARSQQLYSVVPPVRKDADSVFEATAAIHKTVMARLASKGRARPMPSELSATTDIPPSKGDSE